MEADVLVKLDDSVEGRLAKHGDESSADGEQNDGDVGVENKSGGTSNDKSEAKVVAGGLKTLLHRVVNAGEAKNEGVEEHKDKDEADELVTSRTLSGAGFRQTHTLRYPSLIIQRSNFSLAVNSCCFSCVISPERSILVRGDHLDRSEGFSP